MRASFDPDIFDAIRLELRRGCLVLAVLAQLREEHYGYTLRKALSDEGLEIASVLPKNSAVTVTYCPK